MSEVVKLKAVETGMSVSDREKLVDWLDVTKEQILAGNVASFGLVTVALDNSMTLRTCTDNRLQFLGILEALKLNAWED